MYDVVEIVQFYQPNTRTRFVLNNLVLRLDWGSQDPQNPSPLATPMNVVQGCVRCNASVWDFSHSFPCEVLQEGD